MCHKLYTHYRVHYLPYEKLLCFVTNACLLTFYSVFGWKDFTWLMIWSHLSVANKILALKDKYLWNHWFFDSNLSDAPLNEGVVESCCCSGSLWGLAIAIRRETSMLSTLRVRWIPQEDTCSICVSFLLTPFLFPHTLTHAHLNSWQP